MQEALTQPHGADVEAHLGVDLGAMAQHQLCGASATVDDEDGLLAHLDPRHRAGEGQTCLLAARDDLRVDPKRLAHPIEELIPVGDVAGGRGRDEANVVAVVFGDGPGEGSASGERAFPLAESDQLQIPGLLDEMSVGAGRGNQQADGIRPAVNGCDGAIVSHVVLLSLRVLVFGQAWVAPELSQLLDDFVTKGVDAWAGSQGVPSQGMQALDAGRHAAGRDPIDLGDGVQTGLLTNPSAVGKVGLVGASVLLGESLVLTKSFGHPGHQSGGLET